MRHKILLLFFLFILVLGVSASFCQITGAIPDFEKLKKSVFVIKTYNSENKYLGHGSGFIVDENGTCITNYHVLKNAYYVKVKMNNGKEYEMEKITGYDEKKDIARFQLRKQPYEQFVPIRLSNVLPKIGSDVWAIGTPADTVLMNTVSRGIISNVYNKSSSTVLQMSTPIAHGSSGGALVNVKGEVIGVTSWGFEDEDGDGARAQINFAVSTAEIRKLTYTNIQRFAVPVERTVRVSFYTNYVFNGSINLYIEGVFIGSISKNLYHTPDCGESGTCSISLPKGSYKWTAIETENSNYWSGTFNIESQNCKVINIKGPAQRNDYKPTPKEEYQQPIEYGTVSFYDDWKYPFEISIDGHYGSTNTKYSGTPQCGEYGTAKFRLPPGTYSYKATTYGYVLLSQVTYNYSGYVTVVANDCKLIKLSSPQNKDEEISTRNLVVGTNFVHSIFLNNYFRHQKYRTNILLCRSFFQSHEDIKYSGITKTGFDIERVFSTKNKEFDINFSIGPSIRYQFGSFDNQTLRIFNSSTNKWENTTEKVKVDNVFYNVRIGTELIFGDRIVLHGNIGYGYSTQSWGLVGYPGIPNTGNSHENMDYEIYVGYKFGSSKSLFLKYSPQLILPGWADYKRTYGKKGKLKMGIFLTSAATAYFANRYYQKEYEVYKTGTVHDISHYNNANLANKITLVSAGLAGSVYLYDAVHFFTKVKSLK
jgi:hypothetical protein